MLKVDAAGRIRICDELLAYAGVTGTIAMVGGMRKAKLWAAENKPSAGTGKLDLTAFRAVAEKRKLAARAKKEKAGAK